MRWQVRCSSIQQQKYQQLCPSFLLLWGRGWSLGGEAQNTFCVAR
jgi:hypothetical protein